MWALVEEGLKERFKKNTKIKKKLPSIIKAIEKGKTAPTTAANELLHYLDNISLL